MKVRSDAYPGDVYEWPGDLNLGDQCKRGYQLRPHIVWFGEAVPMMDEAIERAAQADVFMVVGSSLQVYPAAGLMGFAPADIPVFYIDPKPSLNHELQRMPGLHVLAESAGTGVPKAAELLRHLA